jgi:hypothetical protein
MKGAVVDRRIIVYILIVVAVVNLVAFANVQDGQAIIFFVLAFGVVYSFDKNLMLALIAAIVGTSMFRAVVIMREGMDSKGMKVEASVGHRLLGGVGEVYCQGFSNPVLPYWCDTPRILLAHAWCPFLKAKITKISSLSSFSCPYLIYLFRRPGSGQTPWVASTE